MKNKACPSCGVSNDYDWPLNISGKIKWGGCQDCWESEVDKKWWKAVVAIDNFLQELKKED